MLLVNYVTVYTAENGYIIQCSLTDPARFCTNGESEETEDRKYIAKSWDEVCQIVSDIGGELTPSNLVEKDSSDG